MTLTLIGINVAIHLLSYLTPTFFHYFAFSPSYAYYEWWRFLTTAFLHAGLLHLVFNMVALYWTGPGLEAVMGKARFLALYLLSALGGTTFVLAWAMVDADSLSTITVGASGAVFGLFGAIFVLNKAMGSDVRSILGVLAVNFIYGLLLPNVSWQGHLGGLIIGALVAWVMLTLDRPVASLTARMQNVRTGVALAGIGLGLAGLQFAIYKALIYGLLGA